MLTLLNIQIIGCGFVLLATVFCAVVHGCHLIQAHELLKQSLTHNLQFFFNVSLLVDNHYRIELVVFLGELDETLEVFPDNPGDFLELLCVILVF